MAATPFSIPGAAEVVKCLAVGGGFLVGTVAGGAVAWALNRWVFANKSPEWVKKAARVACGVLVAAVVAWLVFGDGSGGGLFGGGGAAGDGTGKGGDTKADPAAKAEPPAAATKPDAKALPKLPPVKPPDVKPSDVGLNVTFLGGSDVVGERYYLFDGERMTFEELKAAILKQKSEATQRVYLAALFPATNRIAEESVNVTQVTDWARNVVGIEVLMMKGK